MFHTPTIVATSALVIGSLLSTQAHAAHEFNRGGLLPAACELRDSTAAFEAINCQRPMTYYTLQQVKSLRISAEQFHEAVRCQASPVELDAIFARVCAFAARADARFQRSRNFQLDFQWSSAWGCVQAQLDNVRCQLERQTIARRVPVCEVGPPVNLHQHGVGISPRHGDFVPPNGVGIAPRHGDFVPPIRRQGPGHFDGFDGRPEVLPPPPATVPSAGAGWRGPEPRDARYDARYDALQSLLLSLLR